jgi:hypothetical protein
VAEIEGKADLRRYLQAGRDAVLWKLEGLSGCDVRRPLTPTGANLLGLVKHLAFVEMGYVGAGPSSGLDELGGQPDVVVAHGLAVGQQFAVVVEEDHAVAEEAPTLLGVAAHHGSEVTGLAGGLGAGRYVVAHGGPLRWGRTSGCGIT